MAPDPNAVPIPFTPANTVAQGVTIIAHDRELHMYRLTADELDTIYDAGNYKTIDLALFSVCFGVLVTMWVVLTTVDALTPKVYASFTAVFYLSIIGSLFFGARALVAWKKASKALKTIKGH